MNTREMAESIVELKRDSRIFKQYTKLLRLVGEFHDTDMTKEIFLSKLNELYFEEH